MSVFTMEMLRDAERKLRTLGKPGWGALEVTFSPWALETTEERLFPASRYRSKRIRKKLIKRFGGEFRRVPCIWRMGGKIICHPALREKLLAALEPRPSGGERNDDG